MTIPFKIPRSTLIVIYTPSLEVLLLERADRVGYWQSVTGSQEGGETLSATAMREVREETGIDARQFALTDWQLTTVYEIYPIWRHRYAPEVTHNTEHTFGLMVSMRLPVVLSPQEHLQHVWLSHAEAAALCFSASNRAAILALPQRARTSIAPSC